MMIDLKTLLKIKEPNIVLIGEHKGIIQSILDFDYLAGKERPSILGIVGGHTHVHRYFFGNAPVTIRGYGTIDEVSDEVRSKVNLFAVAHSGRRALHATTQALEKLPNLQGGMIFAESVPEKHALQMREMATDREVFILGPASVGMVVGGAFKLGAIGGTLPDQIASTGITNKGSVAVVSTSGGMINELISLVAKSGASVSFAAAVGGERFPIVKPVELIKQALEDASTKTILYFGEVGGTDEYEIAALLEKTRTKKPLIAYVAGIVAEKFDTPPQFGHAKALAQNVSETASAKKHVLKEAGAYVADSLADLELLISTHAEKSNATDDSVKSQAEQMEHRKDTLFHTRISTDKGGEVQILGEPLLAHIEDRGLSDIALGMFLGHVPRSQKTVAFFDQCLRLLVDHGPQVSGVVNTMITARAGKDLPAALATGILTVGPRFGGAINQAAENWFTAVKSDESAYDFVERFAADGQYIPGIGHKKYRLDNPDPRVALLLEKFDDNGPHITFAKNVAGITAGKKAQLILNVDGVIAALLLDILAKEEGYTPEATELLLRTEFCNAIFVFARSVGFIAHFLEQKRLDEGLFRLPDDQIGI
jgi:succinyl-CoA synthetase alpha subunit